MQTQEYGWAEGELILEDEVVAVLGCITTSFERNSVYECFLDRDKFPTRCYATFREVLRAEQEIREDVYYSLKVQVSFNDQKMEALFHKCFLDRRAERLNIIAREDGKVFEMITGDDPEVYRGEEILERF